jgi:Bacteriophage abortive infection AbiH
MAKLFIVGNGFDLWHGLPTTYASFYASSGAMLDEFEQFYSFDLSQERPWCDFENSLAYFDWNLFYDAHNHIDVASESFKPSQAFGLEDELVEQSYSHVEEIRQSLREWIEGIDISKAEKKLTFPSDSSFITFNYTSTLQSIYGVPDEKIFHVHGRADNFDQLIFGHGGTREEEPELDENGDSNRTMFSDAEAAAKSPFYALQKPVNDVLKKNHDVFYRAQDFSEMVIIGHSLNNIDLPYFKKLAECAPNAQWLICCFSDEDKVHHVEQLVNCGIQNASIKTCTYRDLQVVLFDGRT